MIARPCHGRPEPPMLRCSLRHMEQALCGAGAARPRGAPPITSTSDDARCFQAALRGGTQLPYVGELVAGGRFAQWLRLFGEVDDWIRRRPEACGGFRLQLERIDAALHWLPGEANSLLAALQQQARRWTRRAAAPPLPDIRSHFQFSVDDSPRYVRRTAHGRLGVPGLVQTHGVGADHRRINRRHPGDDAGHLLGKRFGAPDVLGNLVAMNRVSNQVVFNHGQEEHWANLLQRGYGIEATVTAVFRTDDERPFKWRVHWIEISPAGVRTRREQNLLYGNFPAPPLDS